MFLRGQTCLGPITRAGCGAICPSCGQGCEGCRGLIPSPNLGAIKEALRERGMTEEQIDARLSLFLTYQTMQMEGVTPA
jgi:coenzyme F420-reducing hydrogenase gamma subunit